MPLTAQCRFLVTKLINTIEMYSPLPKYLTFSVVELWMSTNWFICNKTYIIIINLYRNWNYIACVNLHTTTHSATPIRGAKSACERSWENKTLVTQRKNAGSLAWSNAHHGKTEKGITVVHSEGNERMDNRSTGGKSDRMSSLWGTFH